MENDHAIHSATPLLVRKTLPHGPPPFMLRERPVQFITMNAKDRGCDRFLPIAGHVLDCARFYHERNRWFIFLFLVMPDHIHALVEFPENITSVIMCGNWKRYVSTRYGVSFQSGFFEHRIRNAAEMTEKWFYIRQNPVRKGLVADMEDWPHWIGFDPHTGAPTKR